VGEWGQQAVVHDVHQAGNVRAALSMLLIVYCAREVVNVVRVALLAAVFVYVVDGRRRVMSGTGTSITVADTLWATD
jgi:hypothetical protein